MSIAFIWVFLKTGQHDVISLSNKQVDYCIHKHTNVVQFSPFITLCLEFIGLL